MKTYNLVALTDSIHKTTHFLKRNLQNQNYCTTSKLIPAKHFLKRKSNVFRQVFIYKVLLVRYRVMSKFAFRLLCSDCEEEDAYFSE